MRAYTSNEVLRIEQLMQVAKHWPSSLTLMIVGGQLHVLQKDEALQAMDGERMVAAQPVFGFSTMEKVPLGDARRRAWVCRPVCDEFGRGMLQFLPIDAPQPDPRRHQTHAISLVPFMEGLDSQMGLPTTPEEQD